MPLERARPALEEALLHVRRERIPFGLFRALLALGETLFAEGDVAQAARSTVRACNSRARHRF